MARDDRVAQLIDLLRDAISSGDDDLAQVVRSDLFKEFGLEMNQGGIAGYAAGGPAGLYANIHAKRKRIKAGSGEKMRQAGSQGAPTQQSFIDSAKTAKKAGGGMMGINRMTAPLGYREGNNSGEVVGDREKTGIRGLIEKWFAPEQREDGGAERMKIFNFLWNQGFDQQQIDDIISRKVNQEDIVPSRRKIDAEGNLYIEPGDFKG